jgi:tRNA uridine 5-carboxymethylaminomethyl modification enzyme
MFTSRAEYRLHLREDNADLRLTETGHALGVVPQARYDALRTKRDAVDCEMQRLQALWATPTNALGAAIESKLGVVVSRETNVLDLLRRPELDYAMLTTVSGLGPSVARDDVAEQVEVQVKYAGYLLRQREEIERQRRNEHTAIPATFDYDKVRGLSAEVLLKLKRTLPATVGQATRISGVTPAAISLLLVHLKRRAAA